VDRCQCSKVSRWGGKTLTRSILVAQSQTKLKKHAHTTFVSSCRFGQRRKGLSPLHAVGVIKPAAAGVVDEKGSEYILAHTGPRELDGHPQGGCGSGFCLVPGYTTLSVRVLANIEFGASKIKSVRTKNEAPPVCVLLYLVRLLCGGFQPNKKHKNSG